MNNEISSPLSPNKRALAPEDFLSRAEKLKKKKIPFTSESRIIVKANNEGLGFRFDCYPINILGSSISKDLFNGTVNGANRICQNAWTEKKMHETMEFNHYVNILYRLALVCTSLGFLLLLIHMYSESGFALFPISFVFIGIACVMMLLIAMISLFSEPKFISLDKTIKDRLKLYLEEENSKVYRFKEFEWRMEKDFYWLELVNFKTNIIKTEGNEIKFNFRK